MRKKIALLALSGLLSCAIMFAQTSFADTTTTSTFSDFEWYLSGTIGNLQNVGGAVPDARYAHYFQQEFADHSTGFTPYYGNYNYGTETALIYSAVHSSPYPSGTATSSYDIKYAGSGNGDPHTSGSGTITSTANINRNPAHISDSTAAYSTGLDLAFIDYTPNVADSGKMNIKGKWSWSFANTPSAGTTDWQGSVDLYIYDTIILWSSGQTPQTWSGQNKIELYRSSYFLGAGSWDLDINMLLLDINPYSTSFNFLDGNGNPWGGTFTPVLARHLLSIYVDANAWEQGIAEPNNAVPEPTTMLLLGFGLVGLAGVRRFK